MEYIVFFKKDIAVPASLKDVLTDVEDIVIIDDTDKENILIQGTEEAIGSLKNIMGDICIIEPNSQYELVDLPSR
jgi:hypothetical protein